MPDLRFALRQLLRSPGFTLTALATIAICLGANLAIFAVIDAILLRPLPFPNSDRLVTVYNTYPKAGVENDGSSLTNYYERRGQIPAFASLSLYMERAETVGDPGSMRQEEIVRVSPEFFQTLGVNFALGRSFTEDETNAQKNVIILSDAFWRQQFAADPNVLGRETRINGIPRKIVGVLPPGFRFLSSEARVFLPIKSDIEQRSAKARHSGGGGTHLVARLRAGATIAQAQAQIDAHNDAVEKDDPEAKAMAEAGFRSLVVGLHAEHVRAIRPMLLLLQSGVLFLLFIGAVNLVNLLLIRASDRAKEMAIRRSMGASRWHIVRQVASETVLLTFSGGVLGLVVGAWGTRLLEILGANRLPLGAHIRFDALLAAVGLLGAIVLGIVIAAPIAWFNLRSQLARTLQSESRSGTISRSGQRLRHSFVIAQISLAFILLAGAALLGLSLKNAMTVPAGFRPGQVLTGECAFSWRLIRDRVAIMDRLLESIREQPGLVAAGMITNIPLSGDSGKTAVAPKGYAPPPGQSAHGHYTYGVHGDYFAALGIPLREGRVLTSEDSHRTQRVCVVDEDFAQRYWPQRSALGQRLAIGNETDDAQLFTVVGVVGAVKQTELTEPAGQGAVYVPLAERATNSVFVVTRTSQRPESFAATLRKLVRLANPELAIGDIRSMETRVDESLLARRSPAVLAGIFASVALLLAAIGTYGVLSYSVAQRRREIGIRLALGAQTAQIARQFLNAGLRLAGVGIVLGLIGAWFVASAMQNLLFAVPAFQPAMFLGAAAILLAISFAACWFPAHRATRVDPSVALRDE